jgi:glycosyltransferase involved in cell wall biosynthesis
MPEGRSARAPRSPLSVVVTTFNVEDLIADCLDSVSWADEILVVDSFSTDRTLEIAEGYPQVRVLQRKYFGAASQLNWGIDRAAHAWILMLDSDERCSPELRGEIEELLARGPTAEAYSIPRRTYFLGHRLRFSGMQHERVTRLIRRGAGRYENRRVHPRLRPRTPAHSLRNPIEHYMAREISEHVRRTAKYGYWGAAQAWREGRRSGFVHLLPRAAWRFVRVYVFQLGVLDGMAGLVYCVLQAVGTFEKWAILWGWQLRARQGLDPPLPEFDEDEATWLGPEARAGDEPPLDARLRES